MKKYTYQPPHKSLIEHNIYADKSSCVLNWLLREGVDKETLSIREVVRATGISLGLVQRIFQQLVFQGYLRTIGIRTTKRFILKRAELLLKSWIEAYSIVKKCRTYTYRSAFTRHQLLQILKKPNLNRKVVLALHSAAEALKIKNTNLETLELYLVDPSSREQTEKSLRLEPQERGYEVLLIDPYYKSWLQLEIVSTSKLAHTSALLTYLDLYHFPLRGQEQAEFLAQRMHDLKRILSHQ